MKRNLLEVRLKLWLQVQSHQLVSKQLIHFGIDSSLRVESVYSQVLSPDEIVLVVLDSEAVLDQEEAVGSLSVSDVELLVLLDRVVAVLELQTEEDVITV